jgi:uncharacterized protein involved in response to NO
LTWHIHEMLFGFVMAAIARFMLTAIPNWTGRAPISGWPLAALAALWLAGRFACLILAWLAAATDLAFPFVLCAVAAPITVLMYLLMRSCAWWRRSADRCSC